MSFFTRRPVYRPFGNRSHHTTIARYCRPFEAHQLSVTRLIVFRFFDLFGSLNSQTSPAFGRIEKIEVLILLIA
jgi:hypothetical protein